MTKWEDNRAWRFLTGVYATLGFFMGVLGLLGVFPSWTTLFSILSIIVALINFRYKLGHNELPDGL